MLVCWNAELVSGRLAEFEQVLCKLPEQPRMSLALPPPRRGSFVCLPYVPLMEQDRETLRNVKVKRQQALVLEIMQWKSCE